MFTALHICQTNDIRSFFFLYFEEKNNAELDKAQDTITKSRDGR